MQGKDGVQDEVGFGNRGEIDEGDPVAKVVHDVKAATFQLAEVAVPRELFAAILGRIGRLRAAPSPG